MRDQPIFSGRWSARTVVALLALAIASVCMSTCASAQGYTATGGGALSSPITTDPVSATGVWTFDNAANTPVTAADGVIDSTLTATRCVFAGASGRLSDDADCTFATDTLTATKLSAGVVGAADAITLQETAGAITFEVTGSDASETRLTATQASGDVTFNLNGSGVNAGTYNLIPNDADIGVFNQTWYVKTGGNINAGYGAQGTRSEMGSAFTLRWSSNATIDGICTGCDTTVERSAVGVVKVTNNVSILGSVLTAATMTSETPAHARDVTSSYTWTNAHVVALGASLTGDITVATLPAKTQLLDAMVVITGAAAGPATVTVSCGDAIAGTPFINYVVASDAKAAANTVYGDAVAERGTSIDTEFWYLPSYTATTLVTCHWISTVSNLDQVTGSTGRVILTTRLLP